MSYKTRLEELEQQAPGAYSASSAVLGAQKALKDYEGRKPGAYTSQYTGQLDKLLQKIQNRKFEYDMNSDGLYQQMKDRYLEQGKQAAKNAAADASALTGGYGNSYAASAAAQANQQYLQGLNDKATDLYSLALARYQQDGNDLATQYGLVNARDATDYARHQDDVTDFYNYLSYLQGRENSLYSRDYGEYTDRLNRYNADRDYLYNGYRGDVSDEQWRQQMAENTRQFNANLALQQQAAARAASTKNSKSSGSGTSTADKSEYSRWYKSLGSKQKTTANKVFSGPATVQGYIANASGHGVSAADTYNYVRQAVNNGTITAEQLDRYMTMYYGGRK